MSDAVKLACRGCRVAVVAESMYAARDLFVRDMRDHPDLEHRGARGREEIRTSQGGRVVYVSVLALQRLRGLALDAVRVTSSDLPPSRIMVDAVAATAASRFPDVEKFGVLS